MGVLSIIGHIIAYGGGSAAIAYLIFQFLSKKWIENQFEKQLEEFKHKKNIEIERLRLEINSMLSRAIKLQEKEFETLPEAWNKLTVAAGWVSKLTALLQNWPKLDRISVGELEEFLEKSELTKTQKDKICQADRGQKLNAYVDIMFWINSNKSVNAIIDYRNYISQNCIFFTSTLKEKFTKMGEELNRIIITKQLGYEGKEFKMQGEAHDKMEKIIFPLLEEIKDEIHNRLHSVEGKFENR